MLYTIMRHIHNMFPVSNHKGAYKIENGSISLPFGKVGQYFLIEGSVLNDGVYQYPTTELTDEEFEGCVTLLAPPVEFLALVDEIESYLNTDNRNGLQSESFGGYSYNRATTSNGTMADWQDIFRQRLNVWRKI